MKAKSDKNRKTRQELQKEKRFWQTNCYLCTYEVKGRQSVLKGFRKERHLCSATGLRKNISHVFFVPVNFAKASKERTWKFLYSRYLFPHSSSLDQCVFSTASVERTGCTCTFLQYFNTLISSLWCRFSWLLIFAADPGCWTELNKMPLSTYPCILVYWASELEV